MRQAVLCGRNLLQQRMTSVVLLGILGWSLVVVGCVPSKVQVKSAPEFNPFHISSIAILPFQALQSSQWGYGQTHEDVRDPEEIRTQFRLPGTDHARPSDFPQDRYSVSDTAAKFITSQVESVLRARQALKVIGSDEFSSSILKGENVSLRAVANDIGDRLKVDGVLMGKVRTYREREGSRIGAKPAAVGFEILLVRPSDGVVLWKGEFFEEQKPLTQDVVGFLEKSGGFVTARELSELGVRKVLETFPVGKAGTPAR